MVPAYAVTLVLLAGRRIRLRTVVVIAAGIAVVGAVASAIDLSRPREDRTHLGRYLTRIQDNGIGEGWSVIQRKLDANLASLGTGILGLVVLVAAALFVGLWVWRRGRLTAVSRIPERRPPARVRRARVLGSRQRPGITVPGIMLVVFRPLDHCGVRRRRRAGAVRGVRRPRPGAGMSSSRHCRRWRSSSCGSAFPISCRRRCCGELPRHRLATAGGISSCSRARGGRGALSAPRSRQRTGLSVDRASCSPPRSGSRLHRRRARRRRRSRSRSRRRCSGRITTGFLKLFGGAGWPRARGDAGSAGPAPPGRRKSLAANLGNLLDRAPGRTIKCALIAYVPLAIVLGTSPAGVAIAPVMGATIALLPDDLHERLMLGDSGANVIGAVLGLGVVLGRGETTRVTALVIVIVLTILAEVVSFSKVIDRVPILRALDRVGTTPERKAA
jgi:hypothetical protein